MAMSVLQRAIEALENAGFHVDRAYEENNRDAGNNDIPPLFPAGIYNRGYLLTGNPTGTYSEEIAPVIRLTLMLFECNCNVPYKSIEGY
jgi:hypothetical protein